MAARKSILRPVASPETLTLATLRTPGELAAIARPWDAMVRAMPRPSPFLLHDWIAAWRRHCGEDEELEVTVARRGDELVGAWR